MENCDDTGDRGGVGQPALARLWTDIRAFIEQYVPAEEQADFELAVWLYLETHPVVREYVAALRAKTGAS